MFDSVLITGTSRGLGLAMVRNCLRAGALVFAAARHPDATDLVSLQDAYGPRLIRIPMDVTRTDSVSAAAKRVAQHTDWLDLVVNNAAAHPVDTKEPLETMNPDHCLDIFDVNTIGPLRVVKAFLPLLERSRIPTVANISSDAGSIGTSRRDREFAYCMSKAALNMESVLLQNHLLDRGIRVLAIHPGWVRTDMGGPRAPLDVADAAAQVLEAIRAARDAADKAVFVDNQGRPLLY